MAAGVIQDSILFWPPHLLIRLAHSAPRPATNLPLVRVAEERDAVLEVGGGEEVQGVLGDEHLHAHGARVDGERAEACDNLRHLHRGHAPRRAHEHIDVRHESA